MAESGIPSEVRQLVDDCIDSVVLLEVLLFLHAESNRQWSVEEISSCLSVEANWVRERLKELHAYGLLEESSQQSVRYRYAPITPQLARAVDALALAYKVRRVAVINLIVKRSAKYLRSFSDAFRLRGDERDEEEGGD